MLLSSLLTAAIALCSHGADPSFDILVFSKTTAFRHQSIPEGLALIRDLGPRNGFRVDATEDAAVFTAAGLADYEVVVFLHTSGDVLDANQEQALQDFVRGGGGWVGIHSAAGTEASWPWYGQMLGCDARFLNHPAIQTAALEVDDRTHPSTSHLAPRFDFTDEWYNFTQAPRPCVNVLLTIDETSYNPGPGAMGADHPIAWNRKFEGGRIWYTSLGHRIQSWRDARFQQHVLGGILWAARCIDSECRQAFLELSSTRLSMTGPPVMVQLDFPASEAGQHYALLASAAGIGSTQVGGKCVPLQPDAYFDRLITGRRPNAVQRAYGRLNAHGDSSAILSPVPGLATYIGRSFFLAAVSYEPSGPIVRRTAAVRSLQITP